MTQAKPAPPAKPPSGGAGENKTLRNAVVIIAVVAAGAALLWLQPILTPLALAIFLLVMIESFGRFLKRRIKVLPGWAAIVLALVISAGLFVGSTWIVASNFASFARQVETYIPRIDAIIAQVYGLFGAPDVPTVEGLFGEFDARRYFGAAAQGLQDVGAVTAFISLVLIYLAFLTASRVGFQRKITRLFPEPENRKSALEIFEQVRLGVERYLWVQTVTGFIIAATSYVVMAMVGMDNAFFWAFTIFVAGYIPILGPLVGGLIPPIFALVQFEGYFEPAVLFVALNAINIVVGNVIQPRMQGDSLNLDPVTLLLALAFWGAIWGVAGMFLSTPLTVLTMVMLAQFKGSRWIAVLMSADGDPLGIHAAERRKQRQEAKKAPLRKKK